MRRVPKVGERVRIKNVGETRVFSLRNKMKGTVMAVNTNALFGKYSAIWPAIQVWLDKPYCDAPTWRAHKEELVILKKDPRAKRLAELKKKYERLRRKWYGKQRESNNRGHPGRWCGEEGI